MRAPRKVNSSQPCVAIHKSKLKKLNSLLVKLLELLINYSEMFGSKPCCFSDIKLFLSAIDQEEHNIFLERTFGFIEFEGDREAPKSVSDSQSADSTALSPPFNLGFAFTLHMQVSDINRYLCWLGLRQYLDVHHSMSVDDRFSFVNDLQRLFEFCHPLVKDYSPTEQRPSDMFVVVAAHQLWEMWIQTRDDKHFWKAVVMLECARKLSPTNHHVIFMLIKFYNQCGKGRMREG